MNLLLAYRSYKELILNGEIQSKTEGEFLFVDIRGNVTGDMLVFVGPKSPIAFTEPDILHLISIDKDLEMLSKEAFESLRQKFKGLTLLPVVLVWLFGIGLSIPYVFWKYEHICAVITGENILTGIWSLLPLIILVVTSYILSGTIGFSLLKYVISIVMWLFRMVRLIRNRKVKELQG